MVVWIELAAGVAALAFGALWCFTQDSRWEPLMATAGCIGGLVVVVAEISRRRADRVVPAVEVGRGGRGGSASVGGSGLAIGGPGGGSGPGGIGGDGGSAHVQGDGVAVGGEGGEAGQADRGGRGGRSGYDIYREAMGGKFPLGDLPPGVGRGGDGSGPVGDGPER